ncbi:deoxyribodipyrimidine photo-lyase [Aestuariivirga sp.]|uniref:cryptochrome/photolyase family protein n=1 Tax=Aestuariivirga sp. TaxID=2650926 RepID=UPI0025C1EFFB|nr:deoxyribodipyrimidine photo-lyase [Aestuariivirga sp.]MCA3554926.1 deoxyribodipyrimidine photo-lyase [Aestuariivirga sp.]
MTAPALYWLRNDLRLTDNAALTAAAAQGPVIFLYVLDDGTPDGWRLGGASRWWLHKSLEALSARVRLVLRQGAADKVIAEVLAETGAASVHFTRDYAPWSGQIEHRVKALAEAAGASCRRYGGFLLHEPESIRNGSGEAYKVYTPFSKACFAAGEPRPLRPGPPITPWTGAVKSDRLEDWELVPRRPDWAKGFSAVWTPGEAGAAARLKTFIKNGLAHYADERDRPDREVTSGLSPHLHFGEISPAQCWHAVRRAQLDAGGKLDRPAGKFLKEVLWREFSYHLLHHWPTLPEKPFRPEFAAFPWGENPKALATWQKGRTGYPIVDAGMRELWVTGIMHNRVRMIAASFLIKDLLIPWQEGERWFWDTLVDADIGNNSASWQWVAGCGADAAPYFRIFNPVLQGEKFDPQGAYVRKWLPELRHMPDEFVHRPWEAPALVLKTAGVELGRNYPHPVIDHGTARDRALDAFREIKGAA